MNERLRARTKLDPALRDMSKLAVEMSRAGQQKGAETLVRFMLSLSPEDPMILANAGAVLLTTDKSGEARRYTEQAIRIAPALRDTFLQNVGLGMMYDGDMEGAIKTFRSMKDSVEKSYDLACALLLDGEWGEGFKLMESRKQKFEHPAPESYPVPEWDGSELDGALWVEAEQGIGDMVMFGRWLAWARSRCKRLVFSMPPVVMGLFHGYPGVDEVRLQDENIPIPDDVKAHVALNSLPALAGATRDSIPADPGYVRERALTWPVTVERPQRAAISVGLVWAGNPKHPRDRERSMPFEALLPLLEETGAQFFSLQVGARDKDPERYGVSPLVEDLAPVLQNYLRTSAVVANLDLVIGVDTSVMHIAGAVETPGWLMIPRIPDWRWGLSGDRTPWWPSLRVFRQKRQGDWAPVVESVRKALRDLIDGKVRKLVRVAANDAAVQKTAEVGAVGPHEPPRPENHHPVA